MSDAPDRPVTVAILVLPETSASIAYGLHDLFMGAGVMWGYMTTGTDGPQYMNATLVSDRLESYPAFRGLHVKPQRRLDEMMDADIICIPGMAVSPAHSLRPRYDHIIEWLKRCHARGSTLAAVCSGTLLLAETGLLDGHDATTHWAICDALQRRFPETRVHRERPLVVTGDGQQLVMGGGGTSWMDVGLYLIGRFVGIDEAIRSARVELVDWHSTGQQPYASLTTARQGDDAVIARCQAWVADNYHQQTPVATMARLSGLAPRTFKRRFQLATGMSPLEYVHTIRLEEAKQALEATNKSTEVIAEEVGYEDASFFSRLFRRKVHLTPAQYRKRFGGMRQALMKP